MRNKALEKPVPKEKSLTTNKHFHATYSELSQENASVSRGYCFEKKESKLKKKQPVTKKP